MSNAERNEKGHFLPGQSGNLSGRPKDDFDLAGQAREHGPNAIKFLVDVMSDPDARRRDRIQAANILLDRGYGKARQSFDIEEKQGLTIVIQDQFNESRPSDTGSLDDNTPPEITYKDISEDRPAQIEQSRSESGSIKQKPATTRAPRGSSGFKPQR